MSNFTPGPWKALETADIAEPYLILDGELKHIVARTRFIGNAILIAAAPEMEDLLWAAWQELSFTSQHPYQTTEQDAKWEAELAKKIYALLLRIEGEEG